jgi:alpha-galactosidase
MRRNRQSVSARKEAAHFPLVAAILAIPLSAVGTAAQSPARVESGSLLIEFDQRLHSRVLARFGGPPAALGPFTASETVRVNGRELRDFAIEETAERTGRDPIGPLREFILTGSAEGMRKRVRAVVYDQFPDMVFFHVSYTNTGPADLVVESWTNHAYTLSAATPPSDPPFWSFQPGSYSKRPDWVLPIQAGFRQENFLGMNATDYGGGTPVVDVWRRDAGIAVGHVEPAPKLVSLPVEAADNSRVSLAITYKRPATLKPGAVLETFRTFVAAHQGDHFRTLRQYSRVMAAQGIRFKPAHESAFEPIWCGWGYGREFTPQQIYGALPVVKKLGFRWVTVDDGWQTSEGDWFLVKEKFPNGDRDMRAMVDKLHAEGFRTQLWWAPLAADPDTELVKKHPEMMLLNADGSRQRITWWDSWYLCPAEPRVVEHHRKLVVKILQEWDYDGLKLDGQFMNGVPPCYNPAHRHARPEEAVEALPRFFQAIYETALRIKPDALVEFCPCGTMFAFHTLPYMNMSVASDPTSSWQVRLKGKTLKALHGDSVAYFGDHVELSDDGADFASTVGVGGVVGSNFRWPPGSGGRRKGRGDLTPDREKHFAKWIALYKQKMLSRGEYLGELYDIGFDRPEAHAIRKGANMYYAFYAPEFQGSIELRGLAGRAYRITDYVNGRDLGTVRGPVGRLDVRFREHLLLEAVPE